MKEDIKERLEQLPTMVAEAINSVPWGEKMRDLSHWMKKKRKKCAFIKNVFGGGFK